MYISVLRKNNLQSYTHPIYQIVINTKDIVFFSVASICYNAVQYESSPQDFFDCLSYSFRHYKILSFYHSSR